MPRTNAHQNSHLSLSLLINPHHVSSLSITSISPRSCLNQGNAPSTQDFNNPSNKLSTNSLAKDFSLINTRSTKFGFDFSSINFASGHESSVQYKPNLLVNSASQKILIRNKEMPSLYSSPAVESVFST